MKASRKGRPVQSLACAACLGAVLMPTAGAQASDNIDFTINEGRVVPSEDFAVKVTVLGAAITSSGVDMPVTVRVNIGGESYEPFGAANDIGEGDVNDGENPRHFIVQEVFDPEAGIDVTGTSWRTSGSLYLQRNSHEESPSVKVLRDGDPVPDIVGFEDQADAVHFIQNYIDPETNTMLLDENQSIYLFELGTTRLSSSAADFQDLVVLVTLGTSPEALAEGDLSDAAYD
jgi:hypothetical protein